MPSWTSAAGSGEILRPILTPRTRVNWPQRRCRRWMKRPSMMFSQCGGLASHPSAASAAVMAPAAMFHRRCDRTRIPPAAPARRACCHHDPDDRTRRIPPCRASGRAPPAFSAGFSVQGPAREGNTSRRSGGPCCAPGSRCRVCGVPQQRHRAGLKTGCRRGQHHSTPRGRAAARRCRANGVGQGTAKAGGECARHLGIVRRAR